MSQVSYNTIYGINNCIPVLNNSNYNIINIFISEDRVSEYQNIIAEKINRKKNTLFK